jgi:predicted nucleotidyltransferase
LSSVRITSVEPAVVVEALKTWAGELRKRKPEVLALGYFGSYATNRCGPGSDLDVLVILEHSEHSRFFDRIPDLYPTSFPVGVDIFAYTKEEIIEMRSDDNPWLRQILKDIIWIFDERDQSNRSAK